MGIQVKNIFYTYQKKATNATQALADVSLTINDNDFLAIVGETGSGKSTLAQMFNALLVPDKGDVLVNDYVINYKNRKSRKLRGLRKHVGLVFQFPEYQLFEETVEKDVAFGVKNFGVKGEEAIKRAHEALKQVGLDESYFKRAPFDLSGGEKRKVAIAGILAIDPDILVFDEPTAGFDPQSSKDLMNLITEFHNNGKTIIIITHDMDLVNTYTKRVVMLERGQVTFDGSPSELFAYIKGYDRLDTPSVIKVAEKLKEKGMDIDIKQIHTNEDLVEAIKKWRNKA
ncbi:MAG: energy-coupling factor transporter ATPase [Bacilli bacterium]|nr:energy-coupling factor transporter ATPase [Bacilli bacterium]